MTNLPPLNSRWRSIRFPEMLFEVMDVRATSRPYTDHYIIYQAVHDDRPCGRIGADTLRSFTDYHEPVML